MALIGSQEPVLYAANPVARAVEGSINYSLGEQRVQFLKAAGMTLFPWQSGFVREFSATATIVDRGADLLENLAEKAHGLADRMGEKK